MEHRARLSLMCRQGALDGRVVCRELFQKIGMTELLCEKDRPLSFHQELSL